MPHSNLEAEARLARYDAIGRWLRENAIRTLFVAHTRDDQAETLLLRLARGSGVDGLSAMLPVASFPLAEFRTINLVRPLLGFFRSELQEYLRALGQEWFEDPMNHDPRFGRIRIRQNWDTLESLGLTRDRLANAAAHFARAREALDLATVAILARACRVEDGRALADREALVHAPSELGLRALATLLMAISRQGYRPRFERLERLYGLLTNGELGAGTTLHGCRVRPAPKALSLFGPGTILIEPERARS